MIMVKVKRVTGRGTGSKDVDITQQNWAGDSYRKEQEKRKSDAGNTKVLIKRGTNTTKLKDIPKPRKRKSTEGRTRITSRGTSTRKSKNRGSEEI